MKREKIKVLIFNSKSEAAEYASEIITNQIKRKPSSVLGLATGGTMIPLYKALIKKRINFSKVKTFNLDEYLNIPEKKTLRHFMDKHFFNKVNIKKSNINFLDSNSKNIKKECRTYEAKLKGSRIDLQILGIGRNEHIAFNEPGSSFKSRTRQVSLTKSTRQVNKTSAHTALTMGIGTIFKAKRIVLLAFGKDKARAISHTLNARASTANPASALQLHPDVKFIVDKSAASKLPQHR